MLLKLWKPTFSVWSKQQRSLITRDIHSSNSSSIMKKMMIKPSGMPIIIGSRVNLQQQQRRYSNRSSHVGVLGHVVGNIIGGRRNHLSHTQRSMVNPLVGQIALLRTNGGDPSSNPRREAGPWRILNKK